MLDDFPTGSPSVPTGVWFGLAINWTTAFRRSIRDPKKSWPRSLWGMNRSVCWRWTQEYRTFRTYSVSEDQPFLLKTLLTLYFGTGFIISLHLEASDANRATGGTGASQCSNRPTL